MPSAPRTSDMNRDQLLAPSQPPLSYPHPDSSAAALEAKHLVEEKRATLLPSILVSSTVPTKLAGQTSNPTQSPLTYPMSYPSDAPSDTLSALEPQPPTPSPPDVVRPYACHRCFQHFTRHHNLKSHMLTHSLEKPFDCRTCGNKFRRLHDLKRHSKLHTGERPFTCHECGRAFARGDALARHAKNGCSRSSPHPPQLPSLSGSSHGSETTLPSLISSNPRNSTYPPNQPRTYPQPAYPNGLLPSPQRSDFGMNGVCESPRPISPSPSPSSPLPYSGPPSAEYSNQPPQAWPTSEIRMGDRTHARGRSLDDRDFSRGSQEHGNSPQGTPEVKVNGKVDVWHTVRRLESRVVELETQLQQMSGNMA